MVQPTTEEIQRCLKHFEDIAPKIKQHSFFGDSNRDKIDAQVEALQNWLKYPEDSVNRWSDEWEYADSKGFDVDDEENEDADREQGIIDNVRDAFRWLNGKYEASEPFVESWDALLPGSDA